jgi:Rieske Fe-S protein
MIALALGLSTAFAQGSLAVDVSDLASGECLQKEWQTGVRHIALPVLICRRSAEQIAALDSSDALEDPRLLAATLRRANQIGDSLLPSRMLAMRQHLDTRPSRSLRRDFVVLIGSDPFHGCLLQSDGFGQKHAAFFNPCLGDTFDSSGRPIRTNAPIGPLFLDIPPHHWQGDRLIIGQIPPDLAWTAYDLRVIDGESSPQTQLQNAIIWGDLDRIRALVQESHDPVALNQPLPDAGATPLIVAIAAGQRDVVMWLLKNGAVVDANAQELAEIIDDEEIVQALER